MKPNETLYDAPILKRKIEAALNSKKKKIGVYSSLLIIPNHKLYSDPFAYRFGVNLLTETLDFLGTTDCFPIDKLDSNYTADIIPFGVRIYRLDEKPLIVNIIFETDETSIKPYTINESV